MMKKIHLLLATTLLFLVACEKRGDAPVFQNPEYSDVVHVNYIDAQCDLTIHPTSVDIDKYIMLLSTSPDMTNATAIEPQVGSKYAYSFRLKDLIDGATYYYQYVLQGYFSSINMDVKSFTTKEYSLPKVITLSSSNITTSACIFYGNATFGGGLDIIEKGACYSTTPTPTIDDYTEVCTISGIGKYSLLVKNLSPETTYYIRAYAKNKKGVGYGEITSFTTLK